MSELLPCPFCGKVPECKRTERFDLEGAMQQARNDAGDGAMPTVFHRKNGKPWVVVMDLDDWIEIYFAYKDYWEQQMLKPDCLHPEDMPKGSDDVRKKIVYNCSECDEWLGKSANYCPNCGAKVLCIEDEDFHAVEIKASLGSIVHCLECRYYVAEDPDYGVDHYCTYFNTIMTHIEVEDGFCRWGETLDKMRRV